MGRAFWGCCVKKKRLTPEAAEGLGEHREGRRTDLKVGPYTDSASLISKNYLPEAVEGAFGA